MQEATAIEYPALWYGNKTCSLQEAWTAALALSSLGVKYGMADMQGD